MKFYNYSGRIAIENPQPMKIFNLPEPSQIIQPYEFGSIYSKKTYLWLKNLPPLFYTNYNKNFIPYLPSNTGGKKRNQMFRYKFITQKESSKTFPEIAQAMAIQWGGFPFFFSRELDRAKNESV